MSALNMKQISILLILVCMDSVTLGTFRGNHRIRLPPSKKIISTRSAAAPFGLYSQAVVVGRMMYISGQVGINVTSGQLVSGARNQTEQALRNIEAILSAAGADLNHVVKTTLMLTDINDLTDIDMAVRKSFSNRSHASALVPVAALPLGALVEIDAIAVLGPLVRKRRLHHSRRRPRPHPRSHSRRRRPHPRSHSRRRRPHPRSHSRRHRP